MQSASQLAMEKFFRTSSNGYVGTGAPACPVERKLDEISGLGLLRNHQHHAWLQRGDVRIVLLDGLNAGVVIRGN